MWKSLICIALLLIATTVHAATVTFQWDTITDVSVAKVNLYQSSSSAAPKPWLLVATATSPATTATITINTAGTYYWYATASNATDESLPSNVVTATVPLAIPAGLKVTITP